MHTDIANFGARALAHRIEESPQQPYSSANREALASAIDTFHSTCGLAPGSMSRSLKLIRGGGTIVRLAHQPNFLPYDNLLLQMRYLHHLETHLTARGHNVVTLVFLVDHDVGSNRRFRRSGLVDLMAPSLTTHIDYPIGAPHKLIVDQQVPVGEYFTGVSRRIAALAMQLPHSNRMRLQAFDADEIQADIVPAVHKSIGTTHVTAFSWLRVAYKYGLAPNLLFLPLSALNAHLRPVYLDLSIRLGPDKAGYERYWTLCPACGGRQRIRKRRGQCIAECGNCHVVTNSPDPAKEQSVRIIPRVVVDILSDYVGLDVSGGTAYGSGWPYIANSHSLGAQIGIRVSPEAAWRTDILHSGPAGAAVYSRVGGGAVSKRLKEILVTGRMSLAYYLAFPSEFERLRQAFDAHADSQETPSEIEVAPDAPGALREWLRTIRNSERKGIL